MACSRVSFAFTICVISRLYVLRRCRVTEALRVFRVSRRHSSEVFFAGIAFVTAVCCTKFRERVVALFSMTSGPVKNIFMTGHLTLEDEATTRS
jgi:hypothetical protein